MGTGPGLAPLTRQEFHYPDTLSQETGWERGGDVTDDARPRLGWIGTGIMGHSLCGHLLRADYPLCLSTRTRTKAVDLLAEGARWADTPRQVAEQSQIVFTMVGFPSDLCDVVLGPDGVLAGCPPGAILVDMTTSRPSLAAEIAAVAAERGVASLDAPVSGGDIGARNATLSIMVGGDEQALRQVMPILQLFGKTIVHQGGPGTGQHTKMVNQILIATGMIGICEALWYAQRTGLDLDKVLESVASGAAGSWSLSHLAPRMVRGDFQPGFLVEHFLKDLGIALDEARRLELTLPGLQLAEQLYRELQARGYGTSGTQALYLYQTVPS